MSSLSIRVAQKATREPLVEVCFPEGSTTENVTLSMLRSAIRDHPDMAMLPERMFTHWYVKGKVLITPIVGDIEEASLADVGLADGGTVLVEFGEGDDDTCVAGGHRGIIAAVVADQRSEGRARAVAVQLAEQSGVMQLMLQQMAALQQAHQASMQEQQALLAAQQDVFSREMVAMGAHFKQLLAQRAADSEAEGKTREALLTGFGRAETSICTAISAGGVRPSGLVGGRGMAGGNDAARLRLMTAVTPCPPSVYTVTYTDAAPGGGSMPLTVVAGHEEFYIKASTDRKRRPFHFPFASVGKGERCLVEFSHTGGGICFGFAAVSSGGHHDPLHTYWTDKTAYMLGLYDTKVVKGGVTLKELPTISVRKVERRVALLLDLSAGGGRVGSLRVFVNEEGGDDVNLMRPYHDEEIPVDMGTYVPCGNLFDKAVATFHRVLTNDDVPRNFVAHCTPSPR